MKKKTCEKFIETANFLVAPLAGVGAIWDLDIGVYVAAGAAIVASILEFVKLFLKK